MGNHTKSFIKDITKILKQFPEIHSREIYNHLFDLGKKNMPTYRQLASILSGNFYLVKEERDARHVKIRYWRNKNVMDRKIQTK